MTKHHTNTYAILSLVFAFVFFPLGFVFGLMALSQIKKTHEQGKGLAIAGIVLSLLPAIIIFLILLGLFAVINSATEKSIPVSNEQIAPSVKQPVSYAMKQNVLIDDIAYKVTRADTFTKMGYLLEKTTNGKFIKVYLDVTNNAKETQQIFTPRFTIVDGQGRRYARVADDIIYIAHPLELGKQINPSVASSGAIVFEVAKDSKDLVLVIRGDWLSVSEVRITLSNIGNVIEDTSLENEQDKMMNKAIEKATEQTDKMMEEAITNSNEQMKDWMHQFE
ncbi:DUF4190 and DUF4352 domain-containing protein [Candidatus Woesearchaeota archaeon]|nr:DUF4190 and DUF4352 domain-containing protein [Candidatus Woesearchaeota archaeon]